MHFLFHSFESAEGLYAPLQKGEENEHLLQYQDGG